MTAPQQSFRPSALRRALGLIVLLCLSVALFGQTETANLSGTVTDPTGAAIVGADVRVTHVETGATVATTTNSSGLYVVSSLHPGHYRVIVEKAGFKQIALTDLTVNVQDTLSRNFQMQVGAVGESITVSGEVAAVNTASASVGTVVDRNFVNSLPMNGRSYQTLLALSPGIVMVPVSSNGSDQGQFSVNGQRNNANYFTVDGISANFGVPVNQSLGQATSGSIPGTDIQGGFTNLASVDALQEFRIQTSTYAPEFGRTPGAQVSLVTRSGQNQFHGSVYEYFRNDATDAKDYFDLTKPPLRFNDFGATLGGPIWRNHTFFFFSYEGQRFLLPQPTLTEVVPSQAVRDAAPNVAKMLLSAYPKPNGENVGTDGAFFRKTYSNPNHLDSYSIRGDHNFNSKYSMFVRYNDTPSESLSRSTSSFSAQTRLVQNTKMLTIGATQAFRSNMVNELRLNASRQQGQQFFLFDGAGGGVLPDPALFLPAGYQDNGARYYTYSVSSTSAPSGSFGSINDGVTARNETRSIGAVDSLSYLLGKHQLKFGFDYRYYSGIQSGNSLIVSAQFTSVATVYANTPGLFWSRLPKTAVVTPNYSSYAQDTWTVGPRLTLTYGLRWDINPAPHMRGGKSLVTLATTPDLTNVDQSGLQLAPLGTPYYPTSYTQFAPRIGGAYQLHQGAGHETVLRAGWGMFYDLNSTPFAGGSWPYIFNSSTSGVPLPLTAASLPIPALNFTPSPTNRASLAVAGRGFTAPRTYEWNFALEQALGRSQSVSFSYVAAQGRDLLRPLSLSLGVAPFKPTASTTLPYPIYWSPNFNSITEVTNQSYSDYHSMQVQFKRALSHGLQALANYTWSHSTDDSSSGSSVATPGYFFQPAQNHGASDFDVRHNFSAAMTYDIPAPAWQNRAAKAVFRDWSISDLWYVRTGLPMNIMFTERNGLAGFSEIRRVSLVPGVPEKIDDPTVPGGWRLNPAAFTLPAVGMQGTFGRNSLYEMGSWQTDLGLHRTFRVTERVKVEFRTEAFNILNHPNFHFTDVNLSPNSKTSNSLPTALTFPATWGHVTQTLSRAFGGGGNTGGFNPLFQSGGPRSMQFSLHVQF